jgi:hypothetical protein
MEFVAVEIHVGKLTFVLSVLEKQGCKVFITAKDEDNRRIWKTPLLDGNGEMLTYPTSNEAIEGAKQKLSIINSLEAS